MQVYFPSFEAIEQHTRQLQYQPCRHCQQTQQLISHGRVYKKRPGAAPEPVGKRVFCSNRNHHTGCGRTMRLYLGATVRRLHYAGLQMVAFVLGLLTPLTVQVAYFRATGTTEPRHAYRWLAKLEARMGDYRSLCHTVPLPASPSPSVRQPSLRRRLLTSTLGQLLMRFGQPLCASFQQQLQRSFL
jgi:hypothetical protein